MFAIHTQQDQSVLGRHQKSGIGGDFGVKAGSGLCQVWSGRGGGGSAQHWLGPSESRSHGFTKVLVGVVCAGALDTG